MNYSIREGYNKRMAFGFRDSTCFFLKIKAGFPVIAPFPEKVR